MSGPKAFLDLHRMTDEQRIEIIGQTVMAGPKSSGDKPIMVGVVVDNAAKAARYIAMMKDKFPAVRVIDQLPMGIGETVAIRFGEPLR